MTKPMSATRRAFWRAFQHITRTKARIAWLLVLACAGLYFLWPNPDVRNILIVLASVSASAIFLPELSSDLWSLRATEMRRAIPERRRHDLLEQLLASLTEESWANYGSTAVLKPFIDARDQPLQVQWNTAYDIHVRLNQKLNVNGEELPVHMVETINRSRRILPAGVEQRIWVSVTQNVIRLDEEYEKEGCLYRDLIPLTPTLNGDDWRRAILDSCDVSVIVDGRQLSLATENYEVSDVVRWESEVPEVGQGQPVPVTIMARFPLAAAATRYPVVFGSYYCAGATEVSFTVENDEQTLSALSCFNYCTRAPGGATSGEVRDRVSRPLIRAQTFTTVGRQSLLWPGSGLVFEWTLEKS